MTPYPDCTECGGTGRTLTERRDSKGRVYEQRSSPCVRCLQRAYDEARAPARAEAAADAEALRWAITLTETHGPDTHLPALRRLLADAERRASRPARGLRRRVKTLAA